MVLFQPINELNDRVHQMFYNILKLSPELKDVLLTWICDCLHANSGTPFLYQNIVNIVNGLLYEFALIRISF